MPLLRRRRPPPAQRLELTASPWCPNRTVPSPVDARPSEEDTGVSKVRYDAEAHTLSIKYTLDIYASIDRVWVIALDSIWDTWNPIHRHVVIRDAIFDHDPRTPRLNLRTFLRTHREPVSLNMTLEDEWMSDAQRKTTIVYRTALPAPDFQAKTRQTAYRVNQGDCEITRFVVEDVYSGKQMESYLRQVLGAAGAEWDDHRRWQADLVRSVKCICRDIKRRCERNYSPHVL